jgi:nucleotide-binding universal stress UspA family protein
VCTDLFENILVPLDGSEHSSRALTAAIQIAKAFRGKLTLIHVYSVSVTPVMMPESMGSMPGYPMTSPADVSRMIENAKQIGKNILMQGLEQAKAENVPVESLLKEGHVVQEVIRTAQEGKFDLIVIGARGMSRIRELLLGSVTDGVVHHVTIPVLVVK